MNHHGRHNPIRLLAALMGLCLLLAAAADPGLFRLNAPNVTAVGGYDAVDSLGQLDTVGDPYYTAAKKNNGPSEFGYQNVYAAAIDHVRHRLFVADGGNSRVVVYDLDVTNHLVDRLADNVLGKQNLKDDEDPGTTASNLDLPTGVAVDEDNGRLFVADHDDHRVLVFDVSGAITDGADAINVLGQPNFTSNTNALPTQSNLSVPNGLSYDPATDRLFVADESRVIVYDADPSVLIANDPGSDGPNAINVIGKPNFTSSGGGTNQESVSNPTHLVVDEDGQRVFVLDLFNNRVMVFDIDLSVLVPNDPGSDGPSAINVIGQTGYFTSAAGLSQSQFDFSGDFNVGITYDPNVNRLFVADSDNARIMVFDADPSVLVADDPGSDGPNAINVLGQSDYVSNTPGVSQSTFGGSIGGMGYDADNDLLYATDEYYHRILVFDVAVIAPDGEDAVDQLGQVDAAGSPAYDVADFDQPDNAPNDRGFFAPEDVALDTVHHRLFVADTENHRVLVFDLNLSNQLDDRVADHVLGQPDIKGHASGTTATSMIDPRGLAYDEGFDRLFVSDSNNNRVLVFDTFTIVDGEAAVNVLGQSNFTSFGAATTDAGMNDPRGIFVDAPNFRLFVVDSGNNRVLVFNLTEESPGIDDGEAAEFVLGQGNFVSSGAATSQSGFNGPSGVAFNDASDRLFVSDFFNNRVMVFDVSTIDDGEDAEHVLGQDDFFSASSGVFDFTPSGSGCGDKGSGGNGRIGVAVDDVDNRLFVSDQCHQRIMVFDTATIDDGEDAVDVVGKSDFSDTDIEDPTQSTVRDPAGLAFNPADDRLYVADLPNNRAMVFEVPPIPATPTGLHVATDVIGQLTGADEPDFDHSGVNNSPNSRGENCGFDTVDDPVNHRVYLADECNARVLMFELNADNQLVDRIADAVLGQPDFRSNAPGATQNSMEFPNGLALDIDNQLLFVTDYNQDRILVFDVDTIVDGEDAVHVIGQPDFTSTGESAGFTGIFNSEGVEYDAGNERLFVTDTGNNRVMVFDLSGGVSDGMPADIILGQPDENTVTPATTQSKMRLPQLSAYDSERELLFVADGFNHRILVFDVDPDTIFTGEPASNVLGADDFTTDDSGVNDHDFTSQLTVTYDGVGAEKRLFAQDGTANRVLVFDVSVITDGEPAVNVLGQEDFTSSGAATTQDGMTYPYGGHYDADNDLLYISEASNSRVSVYDVATIDDGEDAVNLLGQLDENDEPFYTANGVDNAPNAQGFEEADGVAVDTVHHRLFALDLENDRVLVFNLNTDNTLQDHTADFVLGHPDFKSGSPGTSIETLNEPGGISYDSADDLLFVADTSNNRVIVYDTDSITNGEDAIHQIGQPDFGSGDCNQGATADSDTLCHPLGISIEPVNGLLAVSDQDNNRVLVYDLGGAGLPLLADGMAASRVFGQPDFTSSAGGTAADAMSEPSGILAETTTGSIWVTEEVNNRVLRFDLFAASGDPALNVLGQDDFDSSDPATSQAGMDTPVGVAIIESGGSDQRLFVVDGGNSRVLVFNTADGIDDGEDAVDAYGQPTFTDSDCTTTQTGLCLPSGVDYDETLETLYVADSNNHRVIVFGPGSAPTPTPGGGSNNPPTPVGFTPGRIIINEDDSTTDSRNVLVDVYATTTGNFTGTVDVLLSNTTSFETFVPFRYVIPERLPNGNNTRNIWPKTIAWDLCFGITDTTQCRLGIHTVYARFYVNVPAPSPVLVRPDGGNMVSSQ